MQQIERKNQQMADGEIKCNERQNSVYGSSGTALSPSSHESGATRGIENFSFLDSFTIYINITVKGEATLHPKLKYVL